jgi:hypothetical protein
LAASLRRDGARRWRGRARRRRRRRFFSASRVLAWSARANLTRFSRPASCDASCASSTAERALAASSASSATAVVAQLGHLGDALLGELGAALLERRLAARDQARAAHAGAVERDRLVDEAVGAERELARATDRVGDDGVADRVLHRDLATAADSHLDHVEREARAVETGAAPR